MTGVIRAGLLARVSTDSQVDGTSLDEQERLCREEAARLGWVVAMVQRDGGISGGDLDRPALNAIMAACREGDLDAVVVYDQDRLARDERVRLPIEWELRQLGIQYRPLNLPANIDPFDEAEGEMIAAQFGAVAQYVRRKNQRNAANGQRAKARQGRWPGGSPPFGYRLEGSRRTAAPVPDPDERTAIAVGVGALVDDGKTTGEVAALLNGMGLLRRSGRAWTHQTIRRQFESRGLLGEVTWGLPTRRYGHHTKTKRDGSPKYGEPILFELPDPPLTPARFEALQVALGRRAYGDKKPAMPYPNSGAVTPCGGKLGGVWRHDRKLRQYRCGRSKWRADGAPRCACPRIDADWLDGAVWSSVTALLADPARLLAMAADYLVTRASLIPGEAADLDAIERRIVKLQQARVDQVADYLRAGVPADVVAAASVKLDAELAALVSHRDRMEAERDAAHDEQDRATELGRLAEIAQSRLVVMPLEQQREVLALLRVRVTLTDATARPGLLVEGEVPGGLALLLSPAGDPDDGALRLPVAGVTTLGAPIPFRLELAA